MRSLKNRLIAAATAWIVVGILAAGLMLSSLFRHYIREQFDEELHVHLAELQRLSEIDASHFHMQRALSDPRYDVTLSGYYWEIQRGGEILARSPSLQGAMLGLPDAANVDLDVHMHTIQGPTGPLLVAERVRWDKPHDQPVRFIIGTDVRHIASVQRSFDSKLAWSLAALGLSMVGAAGLLLLYAMKPLDHLRQSLFRVRSGAEQRLAGSFPSEVEPLVEDLNTLLGTTGDLVQRARVQAGNIAHTLKTPLAVLVDEARSLEANGQTQAAQVIRDQCRAMQRQIDYQTARARAAAVKALPGVLAAVAATGEEIASAVRRAHRDRGITIDTALPGDVWVACDRRDLTEILANVIDNACHHASARVCLSARVDATGRKVLISCDDDGAGLPEEAFVRARACDRARSRAPVRRRRDTQAVEPWRPFRAHRAADGHTQITRSAALDGMLGSIERQRHRVASERGSTTVARPWPRDSNHRPWTMVFRACHVAYSDGEACTCSSSNTPRWSPLSWLFRSLAGLPSD